MHAGKKLAVTVATGLALAAGGATLATTAAATTPGPLVKAGLDRVSKGCANGVYSGYCGTQKNVADGLAFSAFNVSDWFTFAYQGGNNKIFEYAPNGVASNRCITDSGSVLFLSTCTGATSQQFVATPSGSGFTWQNIATGLFITDHGANKPLTAEPADNSTDQQWNFTTS